jgi:hypothetical protein
VSSLGLTLELGYRDETRATAGGRLADLDSLIEEHRSR